MNSVGFKTQDVFSFSQLIILLIFLVSLAIVSYYLRNKKENVMAIFNKNKISEGNVVVKVQNIDNDTKVYTLVDGTKKYIVMRVGSNITLLDKEEVSSND